MRAASISDRMSINCFITLGAGVKVREATWQMAAPAMVLIDVENQQPPRVSLPPILSKWEICFGIIVSAFGYTASSKVSNPPENYVCLETERILSPPRAPHCHWRLAHPRKNKCFSHSLAQHILRARHEGCYSEKQHLFEKWYLSPQCLFRNYLLRERFSSLDAQI